jgi:hypothetical protein
MKPSFLSIAVIWCVVAAFSPAALAQSPYVDIEQRLTPEQLRSVGITPEQLARLNALLREAEQAQAPAVADTPAAAPVSTVAVATSAAPARREDEPGRDRSSLVGFNDEPIHSRLKGSVSGWEPGTVFELENGQQWKVLKGALKLPRTLDAPEIVVVPGVAGRWFLQVVDGMPKARVYRID